VDFNDVGTFNMNDYSPGDYKVAYLSLSSTDIFEGIFDVTNLPICSDLSNQIAVSTFIPNGGTLYPSLLTTNGGIVNIIADGASGPYMRYALLNQQGTQILGLSNSGSFNVDSLTDGTYRAVHAAFGEGFELANVDPGNLEGCIAVSNVITIIKDSTIPNPEYSEGSVFCASGPAEIVDITMPGTGQIWMDRNLGASQAATSLTDPAAYGDLYQWGRFSDGHQCRNSPITSTLSSTAQPTHGDFILGGTGLAHDWLIAVNANLWQQNSGINNPCPTGYRLPTRQELKAELTYWKDNHVGLNSPFKLTFAGYRYQFNGQLISVGLVGYYWTSTVETQYGFSIALTTYDRSMTIGSRADGFSVRCIKD
jgi:hypothetical protein